MKNLILATTVAFAATTASAQAADLEVERELGLIVSGVVDSWMGVQYIDDGQDDDTVFASGGEGLLSLPLGDNLSIQSDFKYEANDRAFSSTGGALGPSYSHQFAAHVSWRDPMSGLFGVFGGVGNSNQIMNLTGDPDFHFVGGEGQFYTDSMTFYAQAGYVDFAEQLSAGNFFGAGGLDDGFFARGVFRWFIDSTSRLQLEGTYLNANLQFGLPDVDAFSVKARYDFTIAGMPLIGDTPIFIAYRGTFRDACRTFPGADRSFNVDDHIIMIGTSYSFSGDRLTVDRQGATLDTPDFNYNCFDLDGSFSPG